MQGHFEFSGLALLGHEGADMHFIDNEFFVRWQFKMNALPIESGGIDNDTFAHGVADLTGEGVDALESLAAGLDQKLVRIPRQYCFNIACPNAVVFPPELTVTHWRWLAFPKLFCFIPLISCVKCEVSNRLASKGLPWRCHVSF